MLRRVPSVAFLAAALAMFGFALADFEWAPRVKPRVAGGIALCAIAFLVRPRCVAEPDDDKVTPAFLCRVICVLIAFSALIALYLGNLVSSGDLLRIGFILLGISTTSGCLSLVLRPLEVVSPAPVQPPVPQVEAYRVAVYRYPPIALHAEAVPELAKK